MDWFILFFTDDYKEFGTNCESMAAEIEDHILYFCQLFVLSSFNISYHCRISLDCMVAHIYQEIKATDMKYKNRVRSRISNLKDPKNPGLRKNVLAGSIELSRIASMSAEVRDVAAKPPQFITRSPLRHLFTPLSLWRKWPATSWSSWETLSPRRP